MSEWKPAGAGVWVGQYAFRGNAIHTSIIDMGHGRLMVVSPGTNVSEEAFSAVEKIGKVTALVTPGAFHNMGFTTWSARFPDAGLYGPTSAIAHVAKQHPTLKPLAGPDALRPLLSGEFDLDEVAGCKHPDLFLSVRRGGETTWFSNEVLTNNATYPPNFVFSLLFKLFGDHPGLNVSSLGGMFIGAKKPAVRAFLEAKLASVAPTRLVPCHGEVLEDAELGAKIGAVLARRW